MIIKSATGDVDLSRPENVRRGMLFRGNGRDFVAACDGQFSFDDGAPYAFLGCHPEIARREDCERFGIPLRCEQHGVPDAPVDAAAHGFARTREGFAVDLRRAGLPMGAVVQREGEVARRVIWSTQMPRLWQNETFIGLEARVASAEDVERLCCGDKWHEADGIRRCSLAIGDHEQHEDVAAGVKWPAEAAKPSKPTPQTLNVDDIVSVGVDLGSGPDRTGVTIFGASGCTRCPDCGTGEGARCADDCPRVARWKATRCGAKPARGQRVGRTAADLTIATGDEVCANDADCDGRHEADFGRLTWTDVPAFVDCAACAQRVMPYDGGPVLYSAKDAGENRVGTICESCRGTLDAASWPLMIWRGDRLVRKDAAETDEQLRRRVEPACSPPWRLAAATATGEELDAIAAIYGMRREMPVPDRAGVVLAELTREGTTRAPELQGATCPGCEHPLGADAFRGRCSRECFKVSASDEELVAWRAAERRAREAPLVALANAVPAGLDATGWRAAVLASVERCPEMTGRDASAKLTGAIRRHVLAGTNPEEGSVVLTAVHAYQRALAPHKAPPPERKGATWRERGPRLTVDDGRDDG